jgi:hypothetical protein
MDPNPELTKLSYQALQELVENFPPPRMSYGPDYDLIELPEGYTKPPKEEFEAKLQELIDAQPWNELRAERDMRLAKCDWVVIRATSTDTPVPEEWKTYMQALRDLPTVTEDPANPVWPTAPTS